MAHCLPSTKQQEGLYSLASLGFLKPGRPGACTVHHVRALRPMQVGGWTVRYSHGLTFASVRGAGHMVPYTQPERAFHMFSSFVHNQTL